VGVGLDRDSELLTSQNTWVRRQEPAHVAVRDPL